MFVNIGSTQRS